MSEIKKSTNIMQYIAYAVLALVIIAGVGSIFGGSDNGSSSTTSTAEPMF